MELEIEVLWHTEETKKLEKANMPYSFEQLERKTVIFYHIDAISPYLHDGNYDDYCYIHSGGDDWISAYDFKTTRDLIADAKRKSFSNT